MSHEHSHSHAHNRFENITSLKAGYYIAIALTLGFVVYEVSAGLSGNSMGLISDAGHRLVDSISLFMSLVAFRLASTKPSSRYTYGFKKASVLIAFINAVLLTAAVIMIIVESAGKIAEPGEVDGLSVTWTAGIGLVVGAVSALVLMRYRSHDINTRGAFLHLATDALVSIGVLISGLVINATGWFIIDPLVSIVIAAVILSNAVILLKDSFRMIMDGVPSKFRYDDVIGHISKVGNVRSLDNVRIHAVSVTETALYGRAGLADMSSCQETISEIKKILGDMDITEVVIEPYQAD